MNWSTNLPPGCSSSDIEGSCEPVEEIERCPDCGKALAKCECEEGENSMDAI